MKKYHDVSDLRFDGKFMMLIIDGQQKRFNVSELSTVLAEASDRERTTFEISPSGYGIHWPLLDEDISIDGLLGIVHTPKKQIQVV